MYHILLVCNAGMSTSMIVRKMMDAAKEKGVEAAIWAVGTSDIKGEADKADIIMLGPQVKYMAKRLEEQIGGSKKIVSINMMDYGTMNGGKILDHALAEINS